MISSIKKGLDYNNCIVECRCTACGEIFIKDYYDKGECPNCGAFIRVIESNPINKDSFRGRRLLRKAGIINK